MNISPFPLTVTSTLHLHEGKRGGGGGGGPAMGDAHYCKRLKVKKRKGDKCFYQY